MDSLTDIVLWGGLALVLGCALLLTLVCAVVFRGDEFGKRRAPRAKARSSIPSAGMERP